MLKSEAGDHVKPFKDLKVVKDAAMAGDQTKLKASIAHGFAVDTQFPELYNFSNTRSTSSDSYGHRDEQRGSLGLFGIA